MKATARVALILAAGAAARCASTPAPPTAAPEPVTAADFVASIADVAAGRNAALAETGLVLQKIELRLSVGRQTKGGAKVEVLLLDAEASRSAETAFVQELTLEIPRGGHRAAAPPPLVPGVVEFVDSAMNTARDVARAAQAAGLPQKLSGMELTAKITRSKTAGGGITATIPVWVKPSIGGELHATRDEENVVRMVFGPA